MICPNYKNKEVFDGFNEMIEAFGGRPMTEEEFRSGELRNLRTGRDYSAMEAAYIVYNRNGGNFLDKTPLGKPSLLFQTLLSHFKGDRAKAIIVKSNVYSDEFVNWFGDWGDFTTRDTKQNSVSKVVDENDEPLVVWHGGSNTRRFDVSGKYTSAGIKKGIVGAYFSSSKRDAERYENIHDYKYGDAYYDIALELKEQGLSDELIYEETEGLQSVTRPFYLNIKNPLQTIYIKQNDGTYYKSTEEKNNYDGLFIKRDDTNIVEFVATNSTDIKHVENLGTFNPNDPDVYHLMIGTKGAKSLDTSEQVSSRIDNLVIAKQMENAGKNALTIKIATGWERGVDGKWRYEISDVKLKMDSFGEAEIKAVVGNDKNHAVTRDLSDVVDLSVLPPTYREELEMVGEIEVYDDFMEEEKGSYATNEGRVIFTINLGADEAPESILAHEFQHYIQEREGFQPGGNPGISIDALLKQRGIYDVYYKLINNEFGYMRTLLKILTNDEKYVHYARISYLLDSVLDMIGPDESEEDVDHFIKEQIPDWKKGVSYYFLELQRKEELINEHKEELDKAKKIDEEVYEKLKQILDTLPSSYEAYLRLAGEAEARAVGKRSSLSEIERKNSLLTDEIYNDVSREDLIFIYNNQPEYAELPADDVRDISFAETDIIDSFGLELSGRLMNGEVVSSSLLMTSMLSNGIFTKETYQLAELLSKHDIPVKVDNTMGVGRLAKTVTDRGGSVILINQSELQKISRGYLGTTMMHEIIHALTVDIINNPKTKEEKEFARQNKETFTKLNKFFRKDGAVMFDAQSGLYCLKNEKEFAACFASDPVIRLVLFEMAEAIDRTTKSKLVNSLKRLANKLSKAIISKEIFKSTSTKEQLQNYENIFNDFLYNRPTIKDGNIPSKSKLKNIINNINLEVLNHEDFIDSMTRLDTMSDLQENFLELGSEKFNIKIGRPKRGNVLVTSWQVVQDALSTRIDALRGASNLDSVDRTRFLSVTQNQLEMFVVDEAGKYLAIQNLLDSSLPLIISDIDVLRKIRREGGVFTNKDYMYQMHANLGMYHSVFNTIKTFIDDDGNRREMVKLFNEKHVSENDKITLDDIYEIERHLNNAITFTKEGMNVALYMLKENIIHKHKEVANEVGDPEMRKYLDALCSDDTSVAIDDISTIAAMAGPSDLSSNQSIRTLTYLLNKALTSATYNSASVATDLLKLQKQLAKGEHEWDICELDENGNFTSYLVRDLNFGKFYKNYEKTLKEINKQIRDIFNIPDHNLDCRVAPEYKVTAVVDGKTITPKEYFNIKKDEWLNKNAERRYKSKYYKYYSSLPQRIKDSMSEIRVQINAILNSYDNLYDEKGVPHYEKLSDQDWSRLNQLWERRRALRSDLDEYGNLKRGQDLEDARTLSKMYEELYQFDENGNKREKKFDKTGWLAIRNSIISKYGKDSEELREWDDRNTRKTLKKNSYGETIVFKKIEEEFGSTRIDYGQEYEELGKKRIEVLNNHRLANGEPDINSLTQVERNLISEIDDKRSEIRREARSSNKIAERAAKYREIQNKYIRYKNTRQFEKILKEILAEAERKAAELDDADSIFALGAEDFKYSMLNGVYGYYRGGGDSLIANDVGEFVPYSYLSVIEAIDELYMDIEPNDAWIDRLENDLLNPRFEEKYNVSWVPKRELYDNSENYNKIMNSPTLKALYEAVQQTVQQSNELYGRLFADNYLLPQKECTFLGRLRRSSYWNGMFSILGKFLLKFGLFKNKEFEDSDIGINRIINRDEDPNDMTLGQNEIESTNGYRSNIRGTYPDGREFHIIPQYFTKRMKYPLFMSRNIVDNVASYYAQALLYKLRLDIRDDCEAIVDFLKDTSFRNIGLGNMISRQGNKLLKKVGGLNNEQSVTYQYAKQIIERDLYDIQRLPVLFTIGGKTIDVTKILSLWKRWTTARNLGMNPKVAIVGFLTTSFSHILNGIVGYKYSTDDMWRANKIVLSELGKSIFTEKTFIGSRLTRSKLVLLLEAMDMSNQLGRKIEHSNRNRFVLAFYKNSTFGMLSAADFASKSVIMVSTLLSYRYVGGKFLTKHMIEESRAAYGEEKYEKMMLEFKESKVTAWDVLSEENEKLSVDPAYKQAWENIKHAAINKSVKNAEQADGMATRLQKAMMTRSFIGAFALIHRQYIPLMIKLTWGKRVYDYDAQEYKGGQFRTMFNYLGRLAASNALAAGGWGCFIGVAFGGFGFIPLFTGTGAVIWSLVKKYQGSERKSLKESIKDKEFFNDYSSATVSAESVSNKYQIKQTILEVALINCILAPLANFFAAAADDTDKDKKLLRFLLLSIAYWLRAFLFEANSKYNLLDLSNNIKSFTAGTAITDSGVDFLSAAGHAASNTALNIFFSNVYGKNQSGGIVKAIYEIYYDSKNDTEEDKDVIQKGAYKGWTRFERSIFKLLPVHNIYEQIMDPESKRRYQENLVMRLDKEDKRSFWYNLIFNNWYSEILDDPSL